MSETKSKFELAMEKLKEVGTILAAKTPLKMMAEAILDGGQRIMTPADEFAVGVEAFLIPAEGEDPVPMEAGTYELENGGTITISEAGTVEAMQANEGNGAEDAELSDESVASIADKVIEKLGLSKEGLNFQKELEKRDELIAELSTQMVELSKPAVDESTSKTKQHATTKKKVNFTKEEIAKMPFEQRMALKMNQYK